MNHDKHLCCDYYLCALVSLWFDPTSMFCGKIHDVSYCGPQRNENNRSLTILLEQYTNTWLFKRLDLVTMSTLTESNIHFD
jgi:hypothetical protein